MPLGKRPVRLQPSQQGGLASADAPRPARRWGARTLPSTCSSSKTSTDIGWRSLARLPAGLTRRPSLSVRRVVISGSRQGLATRSSPPSGGLYKVLVGRHPVADSRTRSAAFSSFLSFLCFLASSRNHVCSCCERGSQLVGAVLCFLFLLLSLCLSIPVLLLSKANCFTRG